MENLTQVVMCKTRNMKANKILIISITLLLISAQIFSQDIRTVETKVADLLAQLPASDNQNTEKLMIGMIGLGETGIRQICDKIIPAGTGDDTNARFAVESLSRFLSSNIDLLAKAMWEKICISYAVGQSDSGVKDFFIKQLQLAGSSESVEALKGYLQNKDICGPALAAILSIGGPSAETALAESLRNSALPCAAAVMNALAVMKSQLAVNEYIIWSADINVNTRASALNALAQSGSPLAYPVLLKAAKDVLYRWEHTGSTASLLNYARNVAQNGDIKTMDRICKLIISKCDDKTTIQNKISALKIYTGFHGIDAMKELFKAAGHSDKTYRNAAFMASLEIPGDEIIRRWIDFYPKAEPYAKPEIITMLGNFRNELALPLVNSSLSDQEIMIRQEAAIALTRISGSNAIPALIVYMSEFSDKGDQETAKTALMSVAGAGKITLLRPVLREGPAAARKSSVELMAWTKSNEFFKDVLPFTSSDEPEVKSAAFKALASLASDENQTELIELLAATEDPSLVSEVQSAVAKAAGSIADPERRSDMILKAMGDKLGREKIIPILAKTGGREALALVLKEFEAGNPAMREICFNALTSWRDYTASSALFEICASGNKTFEGPAFEGYIKQIKSAPLTDDQKLLLFRKVMPFAISAERKNAVITEIGKLKTYQSLFFISDFIDDPATSAAAAKAAMYIALPSVDEKTGMYGTMVREILTRAVPELTGQESEYDREMVNKYLAVMLPDEGFKPMFNGSDLTGWQGLVGNPITRSAMRRAELERNQAEADVRVPANWSVKDGSIWFNGEGDNLCSVVEYGDFEMLVDWKISREGDSGIYLRGTPQVQIWDTSRVDVGAQVGSGGLYNNQINPSKPLKVADNPVGEWNTFRILMTGERVSVWLNGELVVDDVIMENYWDRKIPIFPKGPIELQAHGTDLAFRDIYIREIKDEEYNLTPEEKSEGFVSLFNGRNLDNWVGNKQSYVAEDGMIVIKPEDGSGGNLYTAKEYSDFVLRFEFLLTPAANNGLGIRAPLEGDAAYVGMELQIIDNTAPVYANLQPYQYHGSVYGVIPAKRDYLKPVGEWNYQEVYVKGTQIKVTLNDIVILDGDIAGPRDKGTMDHNDHPGLKNKTGHIGFLGHGSVVNFKNIRIKDLSGR